MKALITGITGQDGSYLAELLLSKGYEVHGIVRRSSSFNTSRIDHLPEGEGTRLFTHFGDLSDSNSLINLLQTVQPNEIYNIASMSHVRVSFDIPIYTGDVTGLGVARLLEALRSLGSTARFYQASSSEMFGVSSPPQNENTPFQPQSPYGCAKLYGYWMTRAYRTGYKMFACNGILFNHESPRRGETFVTKKIVRAAVRIKLGKQDRLVLGNLESRRDWGFAGDYMEAVYLILHHDKPDDWVVATGEPRTVREFAEETFRGLGLNLYDYLSHNSVYLRPNEVPDLCGDPTKIGKILNWKPKVDFHQLVDMMVKSAYDEEAQK